MEDIIQTGKAVRLDREVDIGTLQVTIGPNDRSNDALFLQAGCSGRIRSIVIEQWQGDGIKVGAGVHDLIVDNVHLICHARTPGGKHQDGIQVMGGRNIRFLSGYVSAFSANNSQVMIHTGSQAREVPEDVVFEDFVLDPRGSGAYGASNGEGVRCGFLNLTLLSRCNLHDLYQGKGTSEPQWSFLSLPPDVRANFDTSAYPGG